MTNEEISYLAGFIDGEGSFIINKREHIGYKNIRYTGYSAYIDIGNTNKEILVWISNLIGLTSKIYENSQKGNRKLAYRIRISYRQAKPLTEKLLPYLIVKKDIAKIFIKYDNCKNKDKLWLKAKKINHRGIKKA